MKTGNNPSGGYAASSPCTGEPITKAKACGIICKKRSCKYHAAETDSYGCNYALITGRSRLGQVRAEGRKLDNRNCEFYDKGKRLIPSPDNIALPGSRPKKYDWITGQRLYEEGYSDAKIAEAIGCTKSAVANWRKRQGLEAVSVRENKKTV